MTNRVDIEVTGSNKFDATQASVNKSLKSIEAQAIKTTAATKKLGTALDEKPKMDGVKEAEKAVKKLQDTADQAFDKVKAKMTEAFDKLGTEQDVKLKVTPEIDKQRLKSSLDNLGGFDIDITSGIGPKIAMALSKGIDLAQAGAKGAASFVTGLGDGLKNQHPAVQAAVYGSLATAALTVGPFIGAVLAGGVVAAFGAGIAGIGVVAAAQNDRVRSVYTDLWDEIVAGIRARSGAIETVLTNTAGRAKTVLSRIAGQVRGSFDDIAPGFERLLDGVLRAVDRFAPALRPMAEAASAVFADIGDRLPGIVEEMAEAFTDLANEVKKNPEALGDFIALMGEVVEIGAAVLGFFSSWRDILSEIATGLNIPAVSTALKAMGLAGKEGGKDLELASDGLTKVGDVAGTTTTKLSSIEQAFRDFAEAEDDAAKRGGALLEILNRLSGIAPSFDEAMQDSNDTIRGLIENFTRSGAAADGFGKQLLNADGTINTMTKNGSVLYDAVSGLRENFADMAGATKELEAAGMSHEAAVKKVNDAFAVQSQRLLDAAGKMGLSQDEMRELLRLYGLTPEQIDTLLKLDDADFRQRLAYDLLPATKRINVVYNNLNAPLTQGTGRQYGATDYAHGGNLSNAASGGVRSREVRINDGPGGYPGEAVRMPDGSTVWPAGMTRMMMQQASKGYGNAMGGGGGTGPIVAEWIGPPDLIEYLKANVRLRGGDESVFG